jgi:hemolysin activation/secretion protein
VLKVREADRFTLQANLANERSPSVGGDRASLEAFLRNALYDGDLLKGEVGATQGTWDASVAYSLPLSADGLLLSTAIDYSHAKAIEEPVNDLDILSESLSVSTGISYPVFRDNGSDIAQKLVLSTSLNFQHSETFLGGIPFPFSPGSVDGTTQYLSAVAGAQYTIRSPETVLALGADIKLGLAALEDDIVTPATPRTNFWLAAARAQLVHRLDDNGLQLVLRADGQYTDGPLFVPDRFSAGGLDSVRGYRKNRALADFGLTASAELQRPLFATGLVSGPERKDISVFAFIDAAHFWSAGPTPPEVPRLTGAGGGIAWSPADWLSARVTLAEPLNDLRKPASEDLQDKAAYFQLTVRPLEVF